MLDFFIWNVLLTAGLAALLTALSQLSAMQRWPALQHWLWLLLLAKLVTPSPVAVPLLQAGDDNIESIAVASADSELVEHGEAAMPDHTLAENTTPEAAGTRADSSASHRREGGSEVSHLGWLVAVSLLGTGVLLLFVGYRVARFGRWLQRAGTGGSALAAVCAEVAPTLGISTAVQSRVVDVRMSPLLWAWRQPTVIVPRQLVDQFAPEQLRSVIAHELAHYVRRDHWRNAFALAVKSLLWWNPVAWWADRQQRAAQELCCDAMVIECCRSNRRGYATTLLKALDFVQTDLLSSSGLAPGIGSQSSLVRRFAMIGQSQLSYRLPRWTPWMLLALGIPMACIPVRGQNETATPVAQRQTGENQSTSGADLSDTIIATVRKVQQVRGAYVETVVGERPTGTCSIRGKVISSETGQPVPLARMYLHYNVIHGSIFINTKSDGTFEFKDIPQGPFSLQSSHTPGYQDLAYNPEEQPLQYPPFILEKDEQRDDIVLEVQRAYRVSGKILDESGKPPTGSHWRVLAWFKSDNSESFQNKQAQYNSAKGSYSLDGLSGKPVYLMAINWRAAKQGTTYPPIYYPSTFSRDDAQLVSFGDQHEITGIDITLQKEGGVILEGTVTDEQNRPVPEAFVVVHRRDMLFDFDTAYSDQQGHYRIQGLGAGEFLVHVDAVHREFVRTCTPLDLVGQDQKIQLDITLQRGATITGKFVDEEGSAWDVGRSYGYAYEAADARKGGGSFSLTGFRNKHRPKSVVGSDGGMFLPDVGDYAKSQMLFPTTSTFFIQGVIPGQTVLSFSPKKERQAVKEILVDGQNIMATGISTTPGESIDDVTIVIGKEEQAGDPE